MRLPPLPNSGHVKSFDGMLLMAYTPDQMQAYGQACREQALDEAAAACDGEQWVIGAQHTSTYMETFNKACSDCEASIRRLK